MSEVTNSAATTVAGITFRQLGKMHYYSMNNLPPEPPLAVGSFVIAETERGIEFGEVKLLRPVSGKAEELPQQYRLLRIADNSDRETGQLRQTQAKEAITLCQKTADTLHLPMKIMDGETAFDGQVVTLYFVADARIDFRQLVRETATVLKMRVHLHQVGSRDHAKALGGYGPCGRPLCCTTFLRDFAPVSMKMAKDQSLYLNPSKFSGVCGKLMCCLRYEHDIYTEAREKMPTIGMSVACPDGARGEIIEADIFKETVTVLIRTESETIRTKYAAMDVTVARACGDCGSAGGGCGSGSCGTDGGCAPAKREPALLTIEHRYMPRPKPTAY